MRLLPPAEAADHRQARIQMEIVPAGQMAAAHQRAGRRGEMDRAEQGGLPAPAVRAGRALQAKAEARGQPAAAFLHGPFPSPKQAPYGLR